MSKRDLGDSRTKFIQDSADRLYALSIKRVPTKIRYGGVVFTKEEVTQAIRSLYDAFTSGWFALGKRGSEFERRFSSFLGIKHCILTNSGSSANLLVVAAMIKLNRFRKGDEILTPAVTFPTAVNPLLLYGLKPVVVDIDLPTYSVSAKNLIAVASSKTKGIMLPHLNGNSSYLPEILELANKRGWILLEDCCDALGTLVAGKYCGTFGVASTFSFYAAHHLSMGEGGAVCTNSDSIAKVVRSLRDWGRGPVANLHDEKNARKLERVGFQSTLPEDYETRYTYVTLGFNLKPLDLQAAIGLAQLKKLRDFVRVRQRNYKMLFAALSKYERYLVLPRATRNVVPSWFVFPLVVRKTSTFSRKDLVDFLENAGIETRPILAGNILDQPAYKGAGLTKRISLPNSDLVLRNGFFVGLYPGLGKQELSTMAKAFDSFFRLL
jgi:CDP-6-deoxy-D-xylo-4-hexulose-3-dehydrase